MKLVIFGLAFLGLVSSRILPTENQKESLREGEVRIDDMILSEEQYKTLYGSGGSKGSKGTRNGVPATWQTHGNKTMEARWPNNTLPYVIDESLLPQSVAISKIEFAISRFNSEMWGCFSIV